MAASMRLVDGVYAQPTPAGAFYAVGSNEQDLGRTMLFNIICESFERPLDREALLRWSASEDLTQALRLLYRLQRMDFVRGSRSPGRTGLDGRLEDLLPPLLYQLSLHGKAVLADDKGLYLAASGYNHEVAEELAALAVDLSRVYNRYERLLKSNLKEVSEALALVSPDGRSDLGCWPLYIGDQQFLLIVEGPPQLNQPALVNLVQLLAVRYR